MKNKYTDLIVFKSINIISETFDQEVQHIVVVESFVVTKWQENGFSTEELQVNIQI